MRKRFTRREFIQTSAIGAMSVIAAACSQETPAKPTAAESKPAPAATKAAAPAAPTTAAVSSAPTQASAATKPKDVARNRTLSFMFGGTDGKYTDYEIWNPYTAGTAYQGGLMLFYEPLFYYSHFQDKVYPWLGTNWKYNSDYTQVTVQTRPGVTWSDGTLFSAEDVAFTFNTLRDLGTKVPRGSEVRQFTDGAKVTDPNTVVIQLKGRFPRFHEFVFYVVGRGTWIVPKHIFSTASDWSKFQHYDPNKGWPVTTGPWQVAYVSPQQKILDRRADWWAVKQGLVPRMPKVERIVYTPYAGETSLAQALIINQVDTSIDLRPVTMKQVLAQSQTVQTWTGRDLPWGYTDWWPTCMYVHNEKPPFNDKDIRWALSSFIDRDAIINVAYVGSGVKSDLPYPKFPSLQPYFDGVKDLMDKYPISEFKPEKGAALLQNKGYKKGSDGFWVDAQGKRITVPLIGSSLFADIGPVIVELLKRQGVDASFSMPPDINDQIAKGTYTAAIAGNAGSISDPYMSLRNWQSSAVTGFYAAATNQLRWKNDKFDAVVAAMAATSSADERDKVKSQFHQAMEVWLDELPDIEIDQWLHRIPYNTAFWKGWPSAADPYVSGALFHHCAQLIINRLEPTQ